MGESTAIRRTIKPGLPGGAHSFSRGSRTHARQVAILEQLAEDARHVLIGVNPSAGARNRRPLVDELCRHLAGLQLSAQVISDFDHFAEEAGRLDARGQLRAVVAAGGDGTFRLYAERLPAGTPLMVFPLGTENLLAGYLEMAA